MNKNLSKILIILIITIILLNLLNLNNYKYEINENFITWFQPFYKNVDDLVPAYMRDNTIYNNFKFDFIDKINIYIQNNSLDKMTELYNRIIYKNLMGSIKINKINLYYKKDPNKIFDTIQKNPKHIGEVTSVSLYKKISNESFDKIKDINTINVTSYNYFFFIVNKFSQIEKIKDLKNKTLNIGESYTDSFYLANDILENVNLMSEEKLKIKLTNYDIDTAFNKLLNKEIDGLFMCNYYPNEVLDKYLYQDFEKELILMPISFFNDDIFQRKNPYLRKVVLDLNLLPENYLPVKIGKEKDAIYYNKFKPDLISYKYPKFLICNRNLYPNVSYNITKAFYKNLIYINNNKLLIKNPNNILYILDLAQIYVSPIHIGSLIFFKELGIITNNSNKYCKYFVGKDQCTDENIVKARIING